MLLFRCVSACIYNPSGAATAGLGSNGNVHSGKKILTEEVELISGLSVKL